MSEAQQSPVPNAPGPQGVASEMRACGVTALARTPGTVRRAARCEEQGCTSAAGGRTPEAARHAFRTATRLARNDETGSSQTDDYSLRGGPSRATAENGSAKRVHYLRGRSACQYFGYDPEELDALPGSAVNLFKGVGNPLAARPLPPEAHVLDIGVGCGTDALLSALQVGPEGHVYGLDTSREILDWFVVHAKLLGLEAIEAVEGDAGAIPLPVSCVDVVISNGVINLVSDKSAVFGEIYRVMRPGGRLQICEVACGAGEVDREIAREDTGLLTTCMAGAVTENEYQQFLEAAGFSDIRLHTRRYYLAGSRKGKTANLTLSSRLYSVIIEAIRP